MLTSEEHDIREDRIKRSGLHTFPLSHKQVADLIGVTRSHYCNVMNRQCWYTIELFNKVMDIDVDWYLKQYPDVMRGNLFRMRAIVEDYEKAADFVKRYGKH